MESVHCTFYTRSIIINIIIRTLELNQTWWKSWVNTSASKIIVTRMAFASFPGIKTCFRLKIYSLFWLNFLFPSLFFRRVSVVYCAYNNTITIQLWIVYFLLRNYAVHNYIVIDLRPHSRCIMHFNSGRYYQSNSKVFVSTLIDLFWCCCSSGSFQLSTY